MRKIKQIIAVLLVVMLMFTTMPTLALQAMAQTVGDILPQKSENSATLDVKDENLSETITSSPTLYDTATSDKIVKPNKEGYNLYTFINGVKYYINMVVDGSYVNGAYEENASTIYTYDTESDTIIATINDTSYHFGTRNDKNYTTVGPVKTSYNGFYCQFYDTTNGSQTIVDTPVANTPYRFGMVQENVSTTDIYYLTGAMSGYYMGTTVDESAAIDVYLEKIANGLTRAEWLHNLVVTFDMTVESTALPDNYFSDLDEGHEYFQDILLAVEFGVVDVAAGGELDPDGFVTRDFAASTLNFCLGYQLDENTEYIFADSADCTDPASAQVALDRGWFTLVDNAFAPDAYITSEEIETMLADASEILAGQVVDENYDSIYDFTDDVIVVPDGTEVTEDENGIVYITDCPETILVGDKFAVYFNGIPSVYAATNVSFNDNVTVVETATVDADNAFDDVDAQGVINTEDMQITAADGVEVYLEDDTSAVSTFAVKKVRNIKSELPISFGGITGKVSVKIKNPYIDYSVNSGRVYVALCGETTVSYSISASAAQMAGLSKGFTLFTCSVAGIGSFDVTVNVDFSGTASGNVKGYLVAGIECEKGGGIRAVKSFTQKEYYTNVEAETSVSIKAVLGVTKMPILSAYVYAEVGVKANFSKKTYYDEKTPNVCTHFAAYLFAEYGASASAKFGVWKTSDSLTYTIYGENNSPVRIVNHYEDGCLVAKCTRGTSYANFFTKGGSRWSGCGWISANGAYGLNADGTIYPLYNYTLNDNNEATITKYNGNSWSVYIPKEIDGYTVVSIGVSAFASKNVGYVSIPDTVTYIGKNAFYRCSNLQTIIIPDTVTTIAAWAFYDCNGLSELSLPKNLKTLVGGSFFGCDSLKSVVIPKSLVTANTVTEFNINYKNNGPFGDCYNLNKVVFEEGTTSIASNLFFDCPGAFEITLPNTVTSIGENAFYNCINMKDFEMPDSVVSILGWAFYNCDSLTDVKLSSKLQVLYGGSFFGCDNIKSVFIPKSLSSVHLGTDFFVNYRNNGAFDLCTGLTDVEFEEGITAIPAQLFYGCTGLKEITIPDTVIQIGFSAFYNCTSLEKVAFSKNLTAIYKEAFYNCTSLSEINLPDTDIAVGSGIFKNCTALEKMYIPNGFAYGLHGYNSSFEGPFYNCSSLKEVQFEEGQDKIRAHLFENCTGLENITIPDTVEKIYGNAFKNCSSLVEFKIPESVHTIYSSAFQNCKKLKSIEIPNTVTEIGDYCFDGCTSLESVKLPNNRKIIVEYMFRNCTSLKTIELPDVVTTIEQYAFYGCETLETVNFSDLKNLNEIHTYAFYGCTALQEVSLPESIKIIDNCSFQNCDALTKVYIPQSTKTIGIQAFYGCEKLSDVTISDYSITTLPEKTFKDCPSIEKIVLPKGLTTIGNQAFMNCTGLAEVTIPESVTSISANAFSYPDKTTVYGKTGSYAETFANNNGFKFVDNTVAAEGISLVDGVEYVEMDRGETYRAKFEFYPENATDVITLTSNNSNVTINGMDIYASRAGDAVITATASSGVTYEFTIHIRDAKSIAITQQPTKLSYVMGDTLDLTGMTVQVTYTDGTVKDVTNYTVTGFDSSKEGDCTVIVSWVSACSWTYETEFTVNIVDPRPKLTGIYIETLPSKLFYERKESLDLTGMVVKATYTDGSVVEITDYTVSGYNALKNGAQTVTVTVGDYTATFVVRVGITITGIKVETMPDKTVYLLGEEFISDGLVVNIVYSDGTTEALTQGYTISGYNGETTGEQTITVTYGDFNDSFTVKVKPPYTPGDANGDDTINNRDLAILMQHINGWNVDVVENALDVNGDGKVNNKDYGLLIRYVNGWDVELQ